MYRHFLKRFLDVVISLCGFVVLFPLFILLAILIKVDDGGPVFFTQKRMGWHDIPFSIYKYTNFAVCGLRRLMTVLQKSSIILKHGLQRQGGGCAVPVLMNYRRF